MRQREADLSHRSDLGARKKDHVEKGWKTQPDGPCSNRLRPAYHHASASQKQQILEGFVTSTGYVRKYAVWLLNHPEEVLPPTNVSRHRYGPEVQHALVLAWKTLNRICAKRLIPFSAQHHRVPGAVWASPTE